MSNPAAAIRLPAIEASTYINASPEKVFACISTAEGWNAWFTKNSEVNLKPGGKLWLVWRNWGVNHVDHEDGGKILEVEPNRKLSFEWHADMHTKTTVTFTLTALGNGTVLKVSDSGYLQEDLGKFAGFLDCAIGWGEAITLLKFYAEHGVTYGPVPN
ncbi:MAG: SRPBCC domain-containing protein [Candidatus Obscuribacterales bacterium]|jgi:uncharacterized protein YndB with AHSA1/START domain|nr:SRPBCC domain-containing protein [Candidatus Obscuribacterales bacterium]